MSTRRVINLCFHGIGEPQRPLEPGEEQYWISPSAYLRILDLVAERDDVRLSFDDGNRSDVELALPGLVERGLRATFFVIAGRLGAPGSLDEAAVQHLREERMVIGSHGMDHRSWRRMDAAAARRELVDAHRRLADVVGGHLLEAAMPRGQYDRRALSQLRAAGYQRVFSSDRAPAREWAWLQPRFSVRAWDTPESIAREVLAPPTRGKRLERAAVGLAKRLR